METTTESAKLLIKTKMSPIRPTSTYKLGVSDAYVTRSYAWCILVFRRKDLGWTSTSGLLFLVVLGATSRTNAIWNFVTICLIVSS